MAQYVASGNEIYIISLASISEPISHLSDSLDISNEYDSYIARRIK